MTTVEGLKMEIYNDKYCVYIHTNKINGKKYVGQTSRNPKYRWGKNGIGYKRNPRFYSAIKHYGWSNFEHEIVASNLTKKEADNFEILLIDKLDTMNQDKGYNLTKGGEGKTGYKHTEEQRKKQSESLKGKYVGEKNPNYGNHPIGSFKGKHHSEETKEKLAKIRNKPVVCIETGVIYVSSKEAARITGIGYENIKRVKNKPNNAAGGYHWIDYVEEVT